MSTETASLLETVNLEELLDENSSCEGAHLSEPCKGEVTWRMRLACCSASHSFCSHCKDQLHWLISAHGDAFNCRACKTPLFAPPVWIQV